MVGYNVLVLCHNNRYMKKRAHVLHNLLDTCVQRRDYAVIKDELQPKREYVLSVRLSDKQIELYRAYFSHRNIENGLVPTMGGSRSLIGAQLFVDFHELMRIWTHPWAIKINEKRIIRNEEKQAERDFIDDNDESDLEKNSAADSSSSGGGGDEIKSEPSLPSPSSSEIVANGDEADDDDIIEMEEPVNKHKR